MDAARKVAAYRYFQNASSLAAYVVDRSLDRASVKGHTVGLDAERGGLVDLCGGGTDGHQSHHYNQEFSS